MYCFLTSLLNSKALLQEVSPREKKAENYFVNAVYCSLEEQNRETRVINRDVVYI